MHVRPDGEKAVEKLHTFSESALHLEVRCLSRKTGLGGRKAQCAPETCHTAQFQYQIKRMISEMYVPTHISKSALLKQDMKSGWMKQASRVGAVACSTTVSRFGTD